MTRNWPKIWSRACFIGSALWLFGSSAWVFWNYQFLAVNYAAISCGYPDTGAKEYAACYSEYKKKVGSHLWQWFFQRDWMLVFLPTAILCLIAFFILKNTAKSTRTS